MSSKEILEQEVTRLRRRIVELENMGTIRKFMELLEKNRKLEKVREVSQKLCSIVPISALLKPWWVELEVALKDCEKKDG